MPPHAWPPATRLLGSVGIVFLPFSNAVAQDLSGRWAYEENGQTAELDVRHDRRTGRATGTLSIFGRSAPFDAAFTSGTLVIQRLGDVRASAENGAMTARLQGGTLMFTVTQPGQPPVTLPMTRRGDATPAISTEKVSGATDSPPSGDAGFRAGSASDFAGRWELTSGDGTNQELVELTVSGGEVTGTLTALEHGYFSKRTTMKGRMLMRGTLANGALQLRVWPETGSPNETAPATGRLRGEYLVLRAGDSESGYARPGRPLVQSAEGSPAAAVLARAVTGRVFSRGSQALGGGGAIAGARTRLALCADGHVEYDVSDVGSAPLPQGGGGSIGSSKTRRGEWSVVLLAGAPAVKAQWHGTGTSYSLTEYFQVKPDASGRSATVDGVTLAVTDRC